MGVRIHAYAVDIPQLDEFLDTSLAELLCRYQQDGIDQRIRFYITEYTSGNTCIAEPQGAIKGWKNSGAEYGSGSLSEEQLQAIPFFQQSARIHINNGSVYQSMWLLRAFSNCKGIDFIHCLINGHRRWWIGSLLQSANKLLSNTEYNELEYLFRKMIRGSNCGYDIPDGDVGFNTDGLPFEPENTSDLRFGRWDANESLTVTTLLSKIKSFSPIFKPPPGPIGIAPEESEWHEWVQGNVTSLLKISELSYSECNVLTFIA